MQPPQIKFYHWRPVNVHNILFLHTKHFFLFKLLTQWLVWGLIVLGSDSTQSSQSKTYWMMQELNEKRNSGEPTSNTQKRRICYKYSHSAQQTAAGRNLIWRIIKFKAKNKTITIMTFCMLPVANFKLCDDVIKQKNHSHLQQSRNHPQALWARGPAPLQQPLL